MAGVGVSQRTGELQGRHIDALGSKSLLPTWPDTRVLEGVGQQGQIKLPPTERGLSMAGGLAGASSACGLRGGQLGRPEKLRDLCGKLPMCQASPGLGYTTCRRRKPTRNMGPGHLGQQDPHSSLPTCSIPPLAAA